LFFIQNGGAVSFWLSCQLARDRAWRGRGPCGGGYPVDREPGQASVLAAFERQQGDACAGRD